MGAVWRAFDEILERPVAIKVLADHLRVAPHSHSLLLREARAAASLGSHPNVVAVHDYGPHKDAKPGIAPYIVMELMRAAP